MIDEKVLGRVANASFYMAANKINPIGFVESFRPNQIKCKKWLVEEICNFKMSWNRVLVLGSWNSVLLYELFSVYGDVMWFDFVDTDQDAHDDRNIYFELNNMQKNYNSINMDATEFSDHQSYDLIINTSCEHMADIPAVYGPTYALQSNNYTSVADHVNCVSSSEQLADQCNITRKLFSGKLDIGPYERYMVIGYYS